MRHSSAARASTAAGALVVTPASEHEFIVRPERMQVAPGSTLPLEVFSAHTFFLVFDVRE
jgi:hypothetical protein